MSQFLTDLVRQQKSGLAIGLYSACTANQFAIRAVMTRALRSGLPVVIEATANQVDQNGGYTGLTPALFRDYVWSLALECHFPSDQIFLGGDHLGPLTRAWQPEPEAMAYAEQLVTDYVLAGFVKIHLDTSMRLGSDDPALPLPVATIAERGARLCLAAERAYRQRLVMHPGSTAPVYIIGSEVPIPGGSQETESSITVTSPASCQETVSAYRAAFSRLALDEVFKRVIALVVQPGVEFGDAEIFAYDPDRARALTDFGRTGLDMVFEGHSTDYQTRTALKAMVRDGIAILKVGPALTFALREAV